MIVSPRNPNEWGIMAQFIHEYAHVQPQPDLRMIGWADSEDKLQMVVALTSFLGRTAQIHVANAPGWHFTSRAILRAVFRYAFIDCKLKLLLGIVNSDNEKAMAYDKHLGFKELWRLRGLHDDGGDIVVLGMYADECRYLSDSGKETNHADVCAVSGT